MKFNPIASRVSASLAVQAIHWPVVILIGLVVLLHQPVSAAAQNVADTGPGAPTESVQLQSTTWLIVRHAEREGDADQLSLDGRERAADLKRLGEILNVDVIYSTDTVRTRSTVKLLAQSRGIEIKTYAETSAAWFDEIKMQHAGDVVLIVGHSNTVGVIAGQLAETQSFQIAHDEHDSLFVITTSTPPVVVQPTDNKIPKTDAIAKSTPTLVRIKYGRPSVESPSRKAAPATPTGC